MDGQLEPTSARPASGAEVTRDWMQAVISLLEEAAGQIPDQIHPVQAVLLEVTSLLRQRIDPAATRAAGKGRGCLLAWQARKVRDYIDTHITGPIHVADLSALVQRSEAHFSRSFKCTFGESPHSFVVRRRVELAAHCMIETDGSLSDIAQQCGFADQAHLCKHFRLASGETPSAWRRARRSYDPNHPQGGHQYRQRSALDSNNSSHCRRMVGPW